MLTTAELKIVQVNLSRTSLTIMNISAANALFIRDGAGVGTENAIRLGPGSSISYRIPEDDPTTAFWALAQGGTIVAIVQEQVGTKPLPVRSI